MPVKDEGERRDEFHGDAQLLGTLLRQIHALSTTTALHTRRMLQSVGLNETSASVLWMLDPAEPPATMRELARRIGCDPSNITLVGGQLEQAGLTTRAVNPVDARSRLLKLTPAGQRLRRRMVESMLLNTPLTALTIAEQRQLARLLAKLDL